MTIKIVEDGPEITMTRSEHNRLMQEYSKAFQYYSGPVPTFEEWVRNGKRSPQVLNETSATAVDGH